MIACFKWLRTTHWTQSTIQFSNMVLQAGHAWLIHCHSYFCGNYGVCTSIHIFFCNNRFRVATVFMYILQDFMKAVRSVVLVTGKWPGCSGPSDLHWVSMEVVPLILYWNVCWRTKKKIHQNHSVVIEKYLFNHLMRVLVSARLHRKRKVSSPVLHNKIPYLPK